jgi:hypothetical protein
VDLRNHRRRGVVAPAYGTQELLQVGGAELDPGLVEGVANLAAELVVVGEDAVSERLLQLGGRVDQAPVTLPGLGVQELLFLLLRQPLRSFSDRNGSALVWGLTDSAGAPVTA